MHATLLMQGINVSPNVGYNTQERVMDKAAQSQTNANLSRPASPLEVALNNMHSRIGNMEDIVSGLEAKLVTLMEQRDSGEAGTLPPAPQVGVSPVITVVDHAGDRVGELVRRIDSIISRLHV